MDIVCFSINNWEKRKARKQQFMLYLSKRDDIGKVLYIEPPLNFFRLLIFPFIELSNAENRNRWKRALRFEADNLSDKLFLFSPIFFLPLSFRIQKIYDLNLYVYLFFLKKRIKKLLSRDIIIWLYHPLDYQLLIWFKDRVLSIFDWAEEWEDYFIEFSEAKKLKIKFLEEQMVKNADIVFTVSEKILEKAKKFNNNSFRLGDGTAFELFHKELQDIPMDIQRIKKPIAGYLGTFSEKIDLELLRFLSKELPSVSFVFIGDIHRQRVDISKLEKRDNMFFLGGKDYKRLGAYAQLFDVCILPYKSDVYKFTFPTKIYDYLATGKPIVSTQLNEMYSFKDYIFIADSKEQFADLIRCSLQEQDNRLSAMRLRVAESNTWSKRAGEIAEFIKNIAGN